MNAPDPVGPYSQAIEIDSFVYISGQIPISKSEGGLLVSTIEKETEQVMENIKCILDTAKLSFGNIVKSSIFVTDMDNFSKINEVYGSYFQSDPPARETVEVRRLPMNARVEISCIACR